MEDIQAVAEDIIAQLGLTPSVKSLFIEKTDSPWQEKALIKRKKEYLDVKIIIWDDDTFLYGRVYRLFLYVQDVLNPAFQYDPKITPDEDKEPGVRDCYNQIWSLYVDSRMERLNIENFYDRILRRNLFIDMAKEFSWGDADKIFQGLWEKETYTYPEIVDYAAHLNRFSDQPGAASVEVDINRCIKEPYVKNHLERISSKTLQDTTNELLSFTAYNCKDTQIESSHYGISFLYQRRVFIEIIPSRENNLFITILDPETNRYETHAYNEDSDIATIQKTIREGYEKVLLYGKQP
ncbi:MAG: hypothetical protein PHU49_09570 [Syntrophorhabdaceae bacterium]|nr:hypothetical protein [Syntrophorhabdaceae bacterium]MDD5244253.1 hypothetical protein [Syntrophorhabdaceae bacterium]